MATIITFGPRRRTLSPVDRMLSDGLEAIARNYARAVYDRNVVTDTELAAALRQPVSMAAVLADVADWFGIEPPASVEDALGS